MITLDPMPWYSRGTAFAKMIVAAGNDESIAKVAIMVAKKK
jgi:hypothetical protein